MVLENEFKFREVTSMSGLLIVKKVKRERKRDEIFINILELYKKCDIIMILQKYVKFTAAVTQFDKQVSENGGSEG